MAINPSSVNNLTPTTDVSSVQLLPALSNLNDQDAVTRYDAAFTNRAFAVPIGVQQIGAFGFDYRGDDVVQLDNEITDHFLVSNEAAQDHIGVKPNMVTLRGQVSELALSGTLISVLSTVFSTVQNTLSQAPAYLGVYSPGVTDTLQTTISQVQNVAVQIQQGLARANQIQSYFARLNGKSVTKQQKAYNSLASLRDARILFTVYTPFQVFHNMAIMSLRITQPASTKYMSDIVCTMKQLKFASAVTSSAYTSLFGGNLAQNGQPNVDSGSNTGLNDGATVAATTATSFPVYPA